MFEPTKSPTPWVQVDPCSVFPLSWFNIETSLSELNTTGNAGRSYTKVGKVSAPTVRQFKVSFPTLAYVLDADGNVSLDLSPEVNFARLERFYQTHRLHEAFLFRHPVYGEVRARFAEPLTIPRGLPSGGGYLSGVEVKLLEVPTSASIAGNRAPGELDCPQWQGRYVFDFPKALVETRYLGESLAIPLGGGYQFTIGPAKREMRAFTLSFQTMLQRLNAAGKVDWTTLPDLNWGRLEYFYSKHRNVEPFWYDHPVYGRLLVRFDGELISPRGLPRGNGWTDPVTVRIVEVV